MNNEKIHNPATGETLYVLESNEKVFRFEFAIEPGCEIAAEHVHPTQEQQIHVIEGELMVRVNGADQILKPGQTAVIPAGVPHFQANRTDRPVRAIEEHRPAGKAHDFFRVAFALAREGLTDDAGVPKPLIGAALMSEFNGFVRPTSVWLRFLFAVLGPISGLLGYRRIIRRYLFEGEKADIQRSRLIDITEFSLSKPSVRRPRAVPVMTE